MLSEEQAIEKLKKIREQTIRANECGLSNNDFKEEIEVYNTVLNLITKLQKENEEKDKRKKLFEHECRKFKAFCKRVRKDGHDIDLFNQGQEQKCNQFLNLISGEPHWDYEGKYFDETDKEIQKLVKEKGENNDND